MKIKFGIKILSIFLIFSCSKTEKKQADLPNFGNVDLENIFDKNKKELQIKTISKCYFISMKKNFGETLT